MAELNGPRLEPRSGQVKRLVVFLHGYGADGNDLIDIGRAWEPLLPDTAFVSPHAPEPCGQAPVGRQWFPLFTRAPDERWRGVNKAAPVLNQFLDTELERRTLLGVAALGPDDRDAVRQSRSQEATDTAGDADVVRENGGGGDGFVLRPRWIVRRGGFYGRRRISGQGTGHAAARAPVAAGGHPCGRAGISDRMALGIHQGFHAIMNLFLIPLWLLSGSLFPSSGASGWLSNIMAINPLSYGIAALRQSLYLNGHVATQELLPFSVSGGITLAFAVLMFAASTIIVRKTERI